MEKKIAKNLKPCVHRPFRIREYMDSVNMDKLLLTNQLNLYANKDKIIMKTKDRIKYNPIFANEMCILSIKDATKDQKSIISN